MRARFAYLPSMVSVGLGLILLYLSYIAYYNSQHCYGPCATPLYPSPFGLFFLFLGLGSALFIFLVRWRPVWWKPRLGNSD